MKGRIGVMLAALALAACGAVRTISLADLTTEQERFIGDTVRTSGVVREFLDPDGSRYYVLEDGAHNRVQLLPATTVARYDRLTVTVIGVFDVRPALGRVLEVQSIDARAQSLYVHRRSHNPMLSPPGQIRVGEQSFVRALQASGLYTVRVGEEPDGTPNPEAVTVDVDFSRPNSKFADAGFYFSFVEPELGLTVCIRAGVPNHPAFENCPNFPGG